MPRRYTRAMTDAVLLEVADGVAHLTLNRPDRLNAIDAEAARQWHARASEIAERDDVRAVLFDAAGRAFCAGGDVLAMSTFGGAADGADGERAGEANGEQTGEVDVTQALVSELADEIHAGHRLLRESAKPIVAAVQGAVAGGGVGFMLVADVILASEHAKFASKYSDIGLTPDCGVSSLLPEAVGMRRALEFTLTPRTLTAFEARDWGLITDVVPADQLADRAHALAADWAAGPSNAFGHAKRLVRSGLSRSFAESLDDEARTIGAAFVGPEGRTGVAAFAAASAARTQR